MRNSKALFCTSRIQSVGIKHKENNCNEDDTINGNLSEINYSCRVTWI